MSNSKGGVFTARYGLNVQIQFRLILVFKHLPLHIYHAGHAVAQFVGAVGFWCHWNFTLT
jgi:hypothetical protein